MKKRLGRNLPKSFLDVMSLRSGAPSGGNSLGGGGAVGAAAMELEKSEKRRMAFKKRPHELKEEGNQPADIFGFQTGSTGRTTDQPGTQAG